MSKEKKPIAEIHLAVYDEQTETSSTPMSIVGGGQDLATLLLIAFAESEQFYDVAKAAVQTFEDHSDKIRQLHSENK